MHSHPITDLIGHAKRYSLSYTDSDGNTHTEYHEQPITYSYNYNHPYPDTFGITNPYTLRDLAAGHAEQSGEGPMERGTGLLE